MIKCIKSEEALVSSTQDAFQSVDKNEAEKYVPVPDFVDLHLSKGKDCPRSLNYSSAKKPSAMSPPLACEKTNHRIGECYSNWHTPNKSPAPISNEKVFLPWEAEFRRRSKYAIGKSDGKRLEELMTWYSRSISSSLKEGYMKTKMAAPLKNDINNALMFFHLYHSDIKKPLEHSSYLDKMVDLMANFLDLEIKASRFCKDKIIQTKLTQSLYIFLDHSIDHILDALLKTKLFIKKYVDVCYPIMCRILCDPPQIPMCSFSYIRYILAFKIWKKLVKTKEEKIKINKMAVSRLQTPRDFLTKIEDIPGVFPKIPKKMKDVTLYLLQCEFDIPNAVEAFIKFARDPKNIEFDNSLLPNIRKPLFSLEESSFNGFSNIFDLPDMEEQPKLKSVQLEDKSLHSTVRSPASLSMQSVPNSSFHLVSDFTSFNPSSSFMHNSPPEGSPSFHSSILSPPSSTPSMSPPEFDHPSSPILQSNSPSSFTSHRNISIAAPISQDRVPNIVSSSSQFGNTECSSSPFVPYSHEFNQSHFSHNMSADMDEVAKHHLASTDTASTVHPFPVYNSNQESRKIPISSKLQDNCSINSTESNDELKDSSLGCRIPSPSDRIGHVPNSHGEETNKSKKEPVNGHESINNHVFLGNKLEKSAIKCKVKLEKLPSNIFSSEMNEVSSTDNIQMNCLEIKREKPDNSDLTPPHLIREDEKCAVLHNVTTSGREYSPAVTSWSTPVKPDKAVLFHDNNSLMQSVWNCGGVDSKLKADMEELKEKSFDHDELPNGDSVSNLSSLSEDPFYTDICDQFSMGSSLYPDNFMQYCNLIDYEGNFSDSINLNSSGESSCQSGMLWSFNNANQTCGSPSSSSRTYPSQNSARTVKSLINEHHQGAKIMRDDDSFNVDDRKRKYNPLVGEIGGAVHNGGSFSNQKLSSANNDNNNASAINSTKNKRSKCIQPVKKKRAISRTRRCSKRY